MEFLQEQVRLLAEFLETDYRRIVRWCGLGMAAAAALGWAAAAANPQAVDQIIEQFMMVIESSGVADSAGNLSPLGLLANNWQAVLFPVAMGFVPFLFLPLLTLASNGCLLGMMGPWVQQRGMSLTAYLAGILPHGVFEIPALVMSAACGVCLCRNMCRIVTGSRRAEPLAALLGDLLRVMLLLVLPMIAAAAVLETYVTPVVMSFFLR